MPRPFQTNPWPLSTLLTEINNGQIVVPQFQRSFVWDPIDTHKLLVSVSNSYPAGSLLFFKQGGAGVFGARLVEGVDSAGPHLVPPDRLVLDGQQRLTSLYQALCGRGSHLFFIDLKRLDGSRRDSIEDALFYASAKKATETLGSIGEQFERHTMPLLTIFSREQNFDRWSDEYIEHWRAKGSESRKDLRDWLRMLYRQFLKPIYEYEFPVVELDSETPLDAVCNIFVSVNTTGVQLTTFELLTALLYKDGVRLRDLWENARGFNALVRTFLADDEPDYVLKAMSLLRPPPIGSTLPSSKRADLLKLSKSDVESYWYPSVEHIDEALSLLKGECGVLSRRWLPYISILPPMASALAHVKQVYRGPERGVMKQKLLKWYWCSVFAQRYDTAVDSKASTDIVALKSWFAGGNAPEPVRQLSATAFDANLLQDIERQSNAIYRGVICLLVRGGAIDFHKQVKISTLDIASEDIEDHHVFPRGYLGDRFPKNLVNCVLNRTLIDGETNNVIGKNPPSVYLQRVRESGVGEERLRDILVSHRLMTTSAMGLLSDNFAGYLAERRAVFQDAINELTR